MSEEKHHEEKENTKMLLEQIEEIKKDVGGRNWMFSL